MNPTKNVKYIEIEQSIFENLCDYKFEEMLVAVQNMYGELKTHVEGLVTRWMKIKDTELYFDTKNKILIQDTRQMQATDLSFAQLDSWKDIINYLKTCSNDVLNALRQKAESQNQILPSEFDSEIYGLPAGAISGSQM